MSNSKKQDREANLKNARRPVMLVTPQFSEPFRSIRDAARWLGNAVTGLDGDYVSVEVLNFLRKTGLTLAGENHPLVGLRVLDRNEFAPQVPLIPQEPNIPQEPYVPHIPQNANTSVDRSDEFCIQNDNTSVDRKEIQPNITGKQISDLSEDELKAMDNSIVDFFNE